MEEYKIIHARVYEPHKALFKSCRNNKAECQTVSCSNFNNCELYKRKECCWLSGLGRQKCLYGRYSTSQGYTRRANSYYSWINTKKEKYKEVLNKLTSHSNVLAIIGDFIFLPYAHITMNEHIPFPEKESFFGSGICFLSKQDFTIKNIISICSFRPQAIMGGEITSYQKEVVPNFIKHLAEKIPDIYTELCEQYPKAKEYSLSNIGRRAYLTTLNPNVGEFVDCHSSSWKWDGEYLISYNSRASFMLVDYFSELKIKPKEDSIVKITNDEQINKYTKFYKS